MKLFDLHCDTPYELAQKRQPLIDNDLHISLTKAKKYENYGQVSAVWSNNRIGDEEAYQRFWAISDNFISEISKNSASSALCKSGEDIKRAWEEKKGAFVLSVEDARLLCGDISRLDLLFERGVRVLTLLWAGETIIGGSHDTDAGLSDFGKQVTRRCFELGIIPDISHASERSADDVVAIAAEYGRPFIASHSCAYTAYAHTRNLRDRHIEAIKATGGLIGESLCRSHLNKGGASIKDVVRHIEYYISAGAVDNLSLGGDLDGTTLPDGMHDLRDMDRLIPLLQQDGISDDDIEKIFWRNAYEFASRNIGRAADAK